MRAITLGLFDGPFLLQSPPNPGTFGPVRWWDANSLREDYGLTNDALITASFPWRDQSSYHLDAAATLGNEPQFKSSEINDRPVVRLTGTTHLLFNGGDLVMGDFTVLCVAFATLDSIILSRDGFNRQIRTNRNNEVRASWFSGDSGTERISNEFTSNADPRMIGYRRSGGTINPAFYFFDNTNIVEPVEGTFCTSVAFGIGQIGVIDGGPLNIDIAELAIYNKALTDTEIQTLYAQYFKPKFALP